MGPAHPRVIWRRLETEARAVAKGGGSPGQLATAVRHAQSSRFPDPDVKAARVGRRLLKLCERYGRSTAEQRAALCAELDGLAARIGEIIDACTPQARYRADVDG